MALTKLQSFNIDSTGNFTFANITTTNANLGNAASANYFIGNGSLLTSITSANSNYANYAGTIVNSSQPNITSVGTLTSLDVTGNITSGNANLGNAVIANYFIGNLYGTANLATYATTANAVAGANVSGAVSYATTANSVAGANVSGQVGNALVASTVYTNAQPNITSVGTLSNLTSNGTVNFTNTSNVTLGAVANLHIAGGSNGQILATDGAGVLSWIPQTSFAPAYVSNGTSNVSVPAINGNVTITVGGVANVLLATTTGIIIKGNVDAGANYIKGNGYYLTDIDAGTANIANSLVSGNSAVKAQPNGNVYVNVAGTSNTVVFTSTGINIAGYANVTGNINAPYFIGNGAFLTGVDTSPANISNGNSNVSVATANGNVTIASAGNTVVTVTGSAVNVAGNVNATYFVGNGAFLTGVDTSPANISNGTSNVSIPAGSGNITMGVGGTSNVVKVTTLGVNVAGNVNATYFVGNGAYLTGVDTSPANISNGTAVVQSFATAYIPNTSPAQYTDPAVTISMGGISNIVRVRTTNSYDGNGVLTATTPSMTIGSNVTVTGNVNATYFVGNGAFLTGVDTSPSNISNGTSNVQVTTSSNITMAVAGSANIVTVTTLGMNVSGNVNATYFVGNGAFLTGVDTSPANISNGTSNVQVTASGNITMGVAGNANVVKVTGIGVNVSGNVNATYFVGNGAFLTGVDTSPANISNGTSNVQVTTSGNVNTSVAGNPNVMVVTGVGVNVAGNIGATYFIGNGSLLTGVDVTPSSMANGNSNVSIATAGGNATVSVNGTANVLVVAKTGANITGYANITGNVSAPFFIGNGSLLTGVDTSPANISNGSSNVQVAASSNITMGVAGNVAIVTVTGTGANVDGYVTATGNVTGSFVKGNGFYLTGVQATGTGPNISNGSSNVNIPALNGNITMGVSGNANVVVVTGAGINVAGNSTITGQYISTQVTGTPPFEVTSTTQVANLNSATAGTVRTNSQPNITSVGTLSGLTVNGTTTLGDVSNVKIAGGTVSYVLSTDGTGNLSWAAPGGGVTAASIANGTSNVRAFLNGNVTVSSAGNANVVTVTGSAVNVAGNVNATYFVGNGAFLTGVDVSPNSMSSGNSNVNIPTAGGNVNTSVNGTANVLVVAKTGANIAGYANITGNVSAPFFIGNGSLLTGIGTLSNGTSNIFIVAAGGNVTTSVDGNANIMVVTGTGANVAGYLNATGNVNGSNISTTGQLISTVTTGTAPIQVLSTTQVANLNSAIAGTVTTNAQPNITSTGSLTGLAVSNATGIVDFTTTANVTLGYVGNLHITGGSADYVLKTDGAGNLSWTAQGGGGGGGGGTSITNGTSNVNIATVSGNVTVTSAGNTIVTVSDTGANIAGYANITGNVALSGANVSLGAVANLHIAGGSNNHILKTDGTGNLAWIAQGGGGSGVGAIEEFISTAGQTTFTITGGYNVGSAIVFVNGIQMNNADYTATNGTSIILSDARIDGDIVRVLTSMVSPAINFTSLKAYSIAISIALGI